MTKGRCLNIGKPCSKAMSGELIDAESTGFRCPECGSILMPWTYEALTDEKGRVYSSQSNLEPPQKKKSFLGRIKGGPLTIVISALATMVVVLAVLSYLQSQTKQTGIWISDRKKELTVGDQYQLRAVFTPNEQDENVAWSSEDENVVEVRGGMVVAKKEGTAIVSVYRKSKPEMKATCIVYVKDLVKPGEKLPSTMIAEASVEQTIDKQNVEEQVGDEDKSDVQTIEEENADMHDVDDQPENNPNKLTMTLTQSSLKMNVNDKRRVYAYVRDQRGSNITKVVSWSSDDPSIASVDKTGMVKALRPGKTTICAMTNSEEAACNIVVLTTEQSRQTTKERGNMVVSCFGGAATYDPKRQIVTFVEDITLNDDDHGKIQFHKGDVITKVSISDGYLRYGLYNNKIHLNNIDKRF